MLRLYVMEWVSTQSENVPRLIADKLALLLKDQPVTWFVSGGSNIGYQVQTMRLLLEGDIDLSQLTILLIDERFGQIGHVDSNWQQLTDAGFMIAGPTYVAPFTDRETTLEDAVVRYKAIVESVLNNSSYSFAQLGMGDDGHTAGILPHSIAIESAETVVGYEHGSYQRMTLGLSAMRRLDEIVLVALGEAKQDQLDLLRNAVDPSVQPVQVIKDSAKVTVYTENKTE